MEKKKGMSLLQKQSRAGWIFLAPATLMIAVMSFWPMISAFITSLKTGSQREYAVGEPDFLQLYQNVCGSAFLTFRRKYVFVSGDSGTDYAGACHFTGAAFE